MTLKALFWLNGLFLKVIIYRPTFLHADLMQCHCSQWGVLWLMHCLMEVYKLQHNPPSLQTKSSQCAGTAVLEAKGSCRFFSPRGQSEKGAERGCHPRESQHGRSPCLCMARCETCTGAPGDSSPVPKLTGAPGALHCFWGVLNRAHGGCHYVDKS